MLTIQYIIIAVIFIFSVFFIVKKFLPNKDKSSGCGKGCSCDSSTVRKTNNL